MQKLYSRINWENEPSIETPLNEQNLNRMDAALDSVDNRVISQDTTKADRTELNDLVENWVIDEETGIITITKKSGEKILFDLNIEKIPVGFSLSSNGILTMTTDDGTKFTANIGAMIPVLTFNNSDTIVVSVSGAGINKTYSFSIKNGSITEEKLQPNFLSDIKVEVTKAEASVDEAESFAKQSQSYAVGTGNVRPGEAEDNAKSYYEKSKEIYDSLEDSGNVTGVKGNNETSYRSGKVNLTPENIGALPSDGSALNADKLDGLHKSSFLGNGTNFIRPNYIGGSANLNDYTKEWHGFVYNMSNMPSGEYYGFLDVTWFDGAGFTPAPPNGDKGGVVRQIFTSWDTGIMYTRVRPNNTWTAWRAIQTEGSNLVCGDYFYMTDNGGRKRIVLQAIEDGSGASNYGMQLVMGAGGNTFIGSGESASALYTALQTESNKKTNEVYAKGGENMFILSDGHLYLYSNANIVANRKGLCFSNAGILSPVGSDNISFGTLDSPFYDVFATNLRLKPKGANYGSKLLFGDSEYVYLHEDSDDHLLIHANRGAVFEINDAGKIEFGKKQSYSTGSSTQMSYPCWIMPNGDFKWNYNYGQPLQTEIGMSRVQSAIGKFYELMSYTAIIDHSLYFASTSSGVRIDYDSYMLKLYAQSGIVFGSYIKSDICPVSGGTYTLGKSNDRWKEIWCSTSLNTSSDRNLKKNISDLSSDSRYIEFFMLLQPKSYLFKDGESGRTHVGFISQDVEEAMAECGLSSLEFAGFCKDQKMEVEEIIHSDKETGGEEWIERKEHPVFDGDGSPVYEYSLRYEEFISLNTMMIQKLHEKSEALEYRLAKVEEKIGM